MKRYIKNKNGSALVFTMVIIMIVSIIFVSLMQFVVAQIRFSEDRVNRERAFQIAEAGVFYYRWYLAHQIAGKTAQQVQDFWETGNPIGVAANYEAEFEDPEEGGIGKYLLHVDKPEAGSTIVTVESTGWTYKKPNIKKHVKVRFRRPSWSENVVLSDDFLRFGQGTAVNGKIHSNKGIRFDGIANNVISSYVGTWDDPDHSGANEFGVHTHVNAPPGSGINSNFRPAEAPPNPVPSRPDVFQAGRQFPVPKIDFAGLVSDLSFMRSQAAIKLNNVGRGRRIILKTNGTFDTCVVNNFDTTTSGITSYRRVSGGGTCGTCSGLCLQNFAIPDDGIIFVANNVWLEGAINGQRVTIVAAELPDETGYTGGNKNVFLGMGNLLYTNSDGTDIIGVIGQNDVEVIKDSLDTLTIDGALLAKDGRVGRKSYGNKKTTININGSLATLDRYGFSWVLDNNYNCGGGLWIDNGYCFRNLNFDNNLLYFPPPYFPTGTEYSIDLWEEL